MYNLLSRKKTCEAKVGVHVDLKFSKELVEAIDQAAGDKARNEYVAAVLAKELGRPELAAIPRARMGRPRSTSK